MAEITNHSSTFDAASRNSEVTDGILEAFEMIGLAVVMVDRKGRIYSSNRCALKLLVGDVYIKNEKLVTNEPEGSKALDREVSNLLDQPPGGLSSPVALLRQNRRPLLAYVSTLKSTAYNGFDNQAMIIFVDLDAKRYPPERMLRVVFGLSKAEARLAAQLAAGEQLETVADQLGIAKETSRSQLKGIFSKMGIHRQAELVAIFATLLCC